MRAIAAELALTVRRCGNQGAERLRNHHHFVDRDATGAKIEDAGETVTQRSRVFLHVVDRQTEDQSLDVGYACKVDRASKQGCVVIGQDEVGR